MKRFFSPVIPIRGSSSSSNATSTNVASTSQSADVLPQSQSGPSVDVLPLQSGSITPLGNVEYVSDPGLRPKITSYDPNEIENIRRLYLQKGPCQPRNHIYPWTDLPGQRRRFNKAWFDEYNGWLEYSITKDALFCLPCYLFKSDCGDQGGGYTFVTEGFRMWKKKGRLDIHVGAFNSIHNHCVRAAEDLMKQNQHIEVCISRQSEQSRADYRTRLTASLHCIRFLMQQGLSYRGHDESEGSYNIVVPKMEDVYVVQGRSRRNPEEATNHHYYRVNLFYAVVDSQLLELNDRFNEVNTELLICMSCLDPSDSFSAFDKFKLCRFAQFYPSDFDVNDVSQLRAQLDTYILDMRSNADFSEVVGISGLARKLVQSKKHRAYGLVYKLVELALLLPVATASVERVFSAMKIIKTQLRNRMGDEFMNDALVGYIEKDVLQGVSDEDIIQRFQNMKLRRGVL